MSVGIKSNIQISRQLRKALDRLSDFNTKNLLKKIGTEVEAQTKYRIKKEKTDDEGNPWAEWSEEYAKTRESHHTKLQNKDRLLESIQWRLNGIEEVEIGSNLEYAAVHQFGFGDIPARPYLGLSQENEDDLNRVIEDWFEDLLGVKL